MVNKIMTTKGRTIENRTVDWILKQCHQPSTHTMCDKENFSHEMDLETYLRLQREWPAPQPVSSKKKSDKGPTYEQIAAARDSRDENGSWQDEMLHDLVLEECSMKD